MTIDCVVEKWFCIANDVYVVIYFLNKNYSFIIDKKKNIDFYI